MRNKNLIVLIGVIFFINPLLSFAENALPPENFAGSSKNHGVFLQWSKNPEANNYLVEYKESSSNYWSTYDSGVISVPGINITDLENNISYDFRVFSSVDGEQSLPSQTISVTPSSELDFLNSNTQIISTGQSNALGSFALPYLSINQPFNNKMLNFDRSSFIPLVEPSTGVVEWATGESMQSGIANSITSFMGGTTTSYSPIIMSLSGYGGVVYSGLKQGTEYYNSLIQDITAATNLSLFENKTNIVRGLVVVHGESDESDGTTLQQYEDDLLEWQSDYQTDIKNITGQNESVPLFLNQISSHHSFGHATPTIALAQLNASINNPDKIVLVTPSYIFDSSDWMSHMRNYSYRRMGEYFAKAYKKVVIDGEEWKPLMPEEININGNVITARFHVPVPPLVFDTSAVLFKENYGFEYSDSLNSASIVDVQIVSSDTVEITLSNIPNGENPRLRYAYTGTVGAWTGSHVSGAPRGNLRDSDTTQAPHQDNAYPFYFGNNLYNWSVVFDSPIEEGGQLIPDSPLNVIASLGNNNGSVTISFNYLNDNVDYFTISSMPENITVTSQGSPVTINNLSNNTTYMFKVSAVNQFGISDPSFSNNINVYWAEYPVYPTTQEPTVINNGRRKPQVLGVSRDKPTAKEEIQDAPINLEESEKIKKSKYIDILEKDNNLKIK